MRHRRTRGMQSSYLTPKSGCTNSYVPPCSPSSSPSRGPSRRSLPPPAVLGTSPSSAWATPSPTPATTRSSSDGTPSSTPSRGLPTAPPSSAAPLAVMAMAGSSSTSSVHVWSSIDLRSSGHPNMYHSIDDYMLFVGSRAAENLGLPYVPPTLAHNGSFRRGANFAVGAATALDAGFFHERGIPRASSKFPLNTSLGVQLEWFESMKPSLCRTDQECKKFFRKSLFLVGEFGVNDYHFSFQRKTVQEVMSFVPDVVATISIAVETLIKHGVRSLVVPGVIPSGCSPPILTKFAGAPPEAYDSKTGCLTAHNELGLHHNALLQEALAKLRAKHQDVRIIYVISSAQSWIWWSRRTSSVLKRTYLWCAVEGLGGTD